MTASNQLPVRSSKETTTTRTQVPVVTDKSEPEPEDRSQWGNQFQFILTALGLAVGLGNIWRFPMVAYQNGGAAFQIPYLICALTFGFPMVYLEFMVGQWSRSGPGRAIGRYAAGMTGIGWSMVVNSISLAVYYCVIIAWCGVYFAWVVSGDSWKWTECNNWWNTGNCYTSEAATKCRLGNSSTPYVFNNTCTDVMHPSTMGATEEFFTHYMTTRSTGIMDFNEFNWPVFGALLVLWLVTCAILLKGIKIMGYLSYVIVPFPYIIVCILFFRGVTLTGASRGLDYYLFKPDFSKIISVGTWGAALKQLMFSMNVGYGGLISLSSYSKKSNNFFRDTLIIIFGDTLMSIIGGVASFSILGHLSELSGKTIEEVIAGGPALTFVVYPEAISTMSIPWLWNALFFLMLFFLGISSEIALVETFTGMVFDVTPSIRKKAWIVTCVTCLVCLLCGIPMVTDAGFYWFSLLDEFTGSTCSCVVVAAEALVISFYGWRQIKQDLTEMRGEPRFTGVGRWFGPRSPAFVGFWLVFCPLLALVIAGWLLVRKIPFTIELDRQGTEYVYPAWAEVIGWFINLGSILPIPGFFIYKWIQFSKQDTSFHYLVRPTKELASADRYYEQKDIKPPYTRAPKKASPAGLPAAGPASAEGNPPGKEPGTGSAQQALPADQPSTAPPVNEGSPGNEAGSGSAQQAAPPPVDQPPVEPTV